MSSNLALRAWAVHSKTFLARRYVSFRQAVVTGQDRRRSGFLVSMSQLEDCVLARSYLKKNGTTILSFFFIFDFEFTAGVMAQDVAYIDYTVYS